MDGMLSQEEIDALLAQAASGAAPEVAAADSSLHSLEPEVKLYDFKRPEKFSREQLRNLERIHERFARLLSTSLSAYIRTNVVIKIESVTPLNYQSFVLSLPQPTLIHVVELDPLPGQAALELTPTVAFPMFEQMMGGKQRHETKLRPLTDVELTLFQRPLDRMLQCLVETWQDFIKLRPRLIRVEQDPQFAQVAATNTPVVVVSMEVNLGDDFGMMSLCMPDVLVDELLHYLGQERIVTDRTAGDRDRQMVKDVITDVTLPVIGELGQSALTVRQIRELRVNDVLKLDCETGSDIGVYVGNQLMFRAQVGQLRRRMAVRLTGRAPIPGWTDEDPPPDPPVAAAAVDDDE